MFMQFMHFMQLQSQQHPPDYSSDTPTLAKKHPFEVRMPPDEPSKQKVGDDLLPPYSTSEKMHGEEEDRLDSVLDGYHLVKEKQKQERGLLDATNHKKASFQDETQLQSLQLESYGPSVEQQHRYDEKLWNLWATEHFLESISGLDEANLKRLESLLVLLAPLDPNGTQRISSSDETSAGKIKADHQLRGRRLHAFYRDIRKLFLNSKAADLNELSLSVLINILYLVHSYSLDEILNKLVLTELEKRELRNEQFSEQLQQKVRSVFKVYPVEAMGERMQGMYFHSPERFAPHIKNFKQLPGLSLLRGDFTNLYQQLTTEMIMSEKLAAHIINAMNKFAFAYLQRFGDENERGLSIRFFTQFITEELPMACDLTRSDNPFKERQIDFKPILFRMKSMWPESMSQSRYSQYEKQQCEFDPDFIMWVLIRVIVQDEVLAKTGSHNDEEREALSLNQDVQKQLLRLKDIFLTVLFDNSLTWLPKMLGEDLQTPDDYWEHVNEPAYPEFSRWIDYMRTLFSKNPVDLFENYRSIKEKKRQKQAEKSARHKHDRQHLQSQHLALPAPQMQPHQMQIVERQVTVPMHPHHFHQAFQQHHRHDRHHQRRAAPPLRRHNEPQITEMPIVSLPPDSYNTPHVSHHQAVVPYDAGQIGLDQMFRKINDKLNTEGVAWVERHANNISQTVSGALPRQYLQSWFEALDRTVTRDLRPFVSRLFYPDTGMHINDKDYQLMWEGVITYCIEYNRTDVIHAIIQSCNPDGIRKISTFE